MTPKDTILIFSASRTGSTVVWQCARELFTNVLKIHAKEMGEEYTNSTFPCIITERDKVDSFLSWCRVSQFDSIPHFLTGFDEKVTHLRKNAPEVLEFTIDNYKWELECVEYAKTNYKGDMLFLEYEKLFCNHNYIFDKFEEFFGVKIEKNKRQEIEKKTSIDFNKNIQNKLKDFHETDQDSGIHGDHIFSGEPGYAKKILSEDNFLYLTETFKDIWTKQEESITTCK
tara:strand:- start:1616 stop:2299 length:684 start_codon:yes stop_codon:yes gene_type:complete